MLFPSQEHLHSNKTHDLSKQTKPLMELHPVQVHRAALWAAGLAGAPGHHLMQRLRG